MRYIEQMVYQSTSSSEPCIKWRSCLRDKFSQFSRIFAKFAKLNPRETFTGSQLVKLDRRKKYIYINFSLFRIHLTMIMSKIFYRISNNRELVIYIQIMLFQISENLGKCSATHILLLAEEHTTKN